MHKVSVYTVALLSVAFSGIAQAVTVYKWTDADGVTHYSETPPGDAVAAVDRFEVVPAAQAGPAAQDDYFSVINQARRMQAERLALERERAQRAQREAERAALELALAARDEVQVEPVYYPVAVHGRPFHRGCIPHNCKPGRFVSPPLRRPHRVEVLANSGGQTQSVTGRRLHRVERIANGASLLER